MLAAKTQSSKSPSAPQAVKSTGAAAPSVQSALNPMWAALALRVQPKLAVSAPGDFHEREADRVADQVTRMAEPAIARQCAACSQSVAPCLECGQQTTIQRMPETRAGRSDAADGIRSALGAGTPLDSSARAFFEPRFGADFAPVRVHVDGRADRAARRLNALAFTLGHDVVFRAGRYAPDSDFGKHLLAHELTHVVQQGALGPRIQRANDDFRVTQVQPEPALRTQGMADRFFFEFDRSDFRAEVPAEAAERARLEAWAAAHSGQHVRLVGRASQEGSMAHNRELAQQRAATVRSVLTAGGVIVDGTPQIDMTYAQRPVEYRFYRSVEVITAGTTDVTCNAFTPAQQSQDVADCEAAFSAARTRAITIVNAAMARIRLATDPADPPDRDTVLNNRFRSVDRLTLLDRFESVVTRLGEVGTATTGHACNHRCAPGCERPAESRAAGPVTLCAAFYVPGFRGATMSADERVYAVMHETTHSAVVPGATRPQSVGVDVAYARTRLFGVLEGSEAMRNADSYVMALLMLARSTSNAQNVLSEMGVGPADTLRLTTPADGSVNRNLIARRAIGFAEGWLNYASFLSPNMYDFIAESLVTWSATRLGGGEHCLLELFAPPFQMQHPGTAAIGSTYRTRIVAFQTEVAGRGFPTRPIASRAQAQDRTRAAGVYDRFTRMHRRLRDPLVVDRADSGDGSWATAPGLPGLGNQVRLADTFFSLSPAEQVRHVIRLMARAMSDIGGTWVEAYVEAADGVHRYTNLGP